MRCVVNTRWWVLCGILLSMRVMAGEALSLPGAMPEARVTQFVERDGARLFVARYGSVEREPLLLLHGGAGNSEHWAFQVPEFMKHFEVITLDTRGHGRSTTGTTPLSYGQFADDVVAVLNALELTRVSVVGWSDGAVTALDLGLRYPARVNRLVVFAANYTVAGTKSAGKNAAFSAYFARCAADYSRLSATPTEYSKLLAALRPMWRTQPNFSEAQLAKVQAPVLVLDGALDEIIRTEHTQALARVLPHASLEWLEDASHFAHFQRPDRFNRTVLTFLTRVSQSETPGSK